MRWWPSRQKSSVRGWVACGCGSVVAAVKVSGGGAAVILATTSAWALEAAPEREETAVGEEGAPGDKGRVSWYSPWAPVY